MTEENQQSVETGDQAAESGSEELLNAEGQQGAEEEQQNTAASEDAGGNDQVPDEYSGFQLPEGMEMDEELLARANPVFKELGLSQEQAQKLVDLEAARVQEQIDQFQQQIRTWQEEVKTDPELGGDRFDENLALANKAVNEFFEPGFLDALRAYGLTNHPEVIRGLKRIAERYLAEDKPTDGRAPSKEKSRIDRFYGTSN